MRRCLVPFALSLLACSGLLGDDKGAEDSSGDDPSSSSSPPVDVLLVLDNSDSMQPVAESLSLVAAELVAALDANGPDWSLAVTTTSVDYTAGASAGVDPGEAGSLVGDIVEGGDADSVLDIQRRILCDATCWSSNDVPYGWTGECDDAPEPEGEVTVEYLDCLCGAGDWQGHCGSGNEMHLEAVVLAACRAVADPPEECFSYADPVGVDSKPTVLDESDSGSNARMLRDGARFVPLVFTDEGDGSYRLATGDTDVTVYVDLLEALGGATVSVVGPGYYYDEMHCNSGGAQTWAVERLQGAAEATAGGYWSIEAPDAYGECAYTDIGSLFGEWMALGE